MKKFISVLAVAMMAISISVTAQTKSQKVGAKNSPAALMTVRFSNNAGNFLTEEQVNECTASIIDALQNEGGFKLADASAVKTAVEETMEKDKKKQKRQNFFKRLTNASDVAAGKKSALEGLFDDGKILSSEANEYGEKTYLITSADFQPLSPKDNYSKINKAVNKATKCKSFVYVAVNIATQRWRGDDNPVSMYVMTSVYIADAKGEVSKKINAVVLSDQETQAAIEYDPDIFIKQIPDMVKRSAVIAASNLDLKDGLFTMHTVKPDLREDVSDKDFVVLKQANIEN